MAGSIHRRPVSRPALCLLLACGLLGATGVRGPLAKARGEGPPLADLVHEYESWLPTQEDRSYEEQRRVLEQIADLGTAQSQLALKGFLNLHGQADRRRARLILAALVRRGGPQDLEHALRWVERGRDVLLRESLSAVLVCALDPTTRAHLRDTSLRAATPPIKAQIIRALGERGDPGDALALLPLLRDEHLDVRTATFDALGALRADRALPMLLVFLSHEDWRVRACAARAVGAISGPTAWAALGRALQDVSPRVVEAAAQGLARATTLDPVPELITSLRRVVGQDLRLEDAFVQALEALSGRSIGNDPDLWASWLAGVAGKPYVRPVPEGPSPTVEGARYYGFPVRSSRVLFVVDVSRSMGWNGRLDTAIAELEQVIKTLPPASRFNVITYSDQVGVWRTGLAPATPGNVRSALAHVGRLEPVNGTNAYEALERAFREEEADTIFFLSDGHPSVGTVIDTEMILLAVRQWNRHRRVQVHGVALVRGAPPAAFSGMENPERATEFMRRLAAENDGRIRIIR